MNSNQVCGDWAPSETHHLKNDDSLVPTMQLDWYHLPVSGWLVKESLERVTLCLCCLVFIMV